MTALECDAYELVLATLFFGGTGRNMDSIVNGIAPELKTTFASHSGAASQI